MSDTAAPSLKRKLLITGLMVLMLVGGVGLLGYGKALQDKALEFAPFRFKTLEEPALLVKFEFMGNLKSWLTGSDTADVVLSEREFNALLFGHANHGDAEKARVLVEGDALRVEYSLRREGEPAKYVNVRAQVELTLGHDETSVEIVEGHVGELPVKGPLAGWLGKGISVYFQHLREENPRLQKLKALWVKDGKVHLVYTPPV